MKSDDFLHFGSKDAEEFIQKFLILAKPDEAIFLIAGRQAFEASGAASIFSPLLTDKNVVRFSDFTANPKIGELGQVLCAFNKARAGLILSVGGGTAIDLGKLVNYFSATDVDPEAYLKGERGICAKCVPHLAVPTTAGTGSEATHFAVLYDRFKKVSVADNKLAPSHVWLNPVFTASMSPYLTASSGFDALAQAIESYWAVGSTLKSRHDSLEALKLCIQHLEFSVLTPTSEHRAGMLKAAYLAGRAINVAKTTAAHALSYVLTSHYGLSHGHAVALTFPAVFEANANVTNQNINDPRGLRHIGNIMNNLCVLLNIDSPAKAAHQIQELTMKIGLSNTWFETHGFEPEKVRALVLRDVNEERLANNPRQLDDDSLTRIVASIR